ncbi:hypothetical protein NMD1_02472 [Novosphingobium sp. MD-1]|nr:hypothetical protein NMD1_02472 [Novosphingobium sp. MD-1]
MSCHEARADAVGNRTPIRTLFRFGDVCFANEKRGRKPCFPPRFACAVLRCDQKLMRAPMRMV